MFMCIHGVITSVSAWCDSASGHVFPDPFVHMSYVSVYMRYGVAYLYVRD